VNQSQQGALLLKQRIRDDLIILEFGMVEKVEIEIVVVVIVGRCEGRIGREYGEGSEAGGFARRFCGGAARCRREHHDDGFEFS